MHFSTTKQFRVKLFLCMRSSVRVFERTWIAVTIDRVWHSLKLVFHAGKRPCYSRLGGSLWGSAAAGWFSASEVPRSSQSYSRRPAGTSRTWTSLCWGQHSRLPRGRKFSSCTSRSPTLKDGARTSSARPAARPPFSDTSCCRGTRDSSSSPCPDQRWIPTVDYNVWTTTVANELPAYLLRSSVQLGAVSVNFRKYASRSPAVSHTSCDLRPE